MPASLTSLRERLVQRWDELSFGQRSFYSSLAVGALLLAIAPVAWHLARPSIDRWRHRHALAQATEFERRDDYRNMVLALHRATTIAPGDVETWRRVADALDTLGLEDALVAHENLVALDPANSGARTALAAAALRFGAPEVARTALQPLERAPDQRESFLRLSAELARADSDLPRYETLLGELLLLRPEDPELRYNAALLRIRRTGSAEAEEAAHTLRSLLAEPALQVRAALELLQQAARRRDATLAGQYTREIIQRLAPVPAEPDSSSPAPWPALIEALCNAATARGPDDIVRVATWMSSVRLAQPALEWLETLPAASQEAPGVRDLRAELYARTGQLARLRHLLLAGAWGPLQAESVTQAIEARSEFLAQRAARSVSLWQEAVNGARASAPTLRALLRLARLWETPTVEENVLRAALRFRPNWGWANREFENRLLARGETARLHQHCADRFAREPSAPGVFALWARTAVALDRANDDLERRSADLLAQNPDSTPLAVARAGLLWRRSRPEEAAALLDRLPPSAISLPEVVLLRTLLGSPPTPSEVPPLLLPEERKLLTDVRPPTPS